MSRQSPIAVLPFTALVHETRNGESPTGQAPALVQETIATVLSKLTNFFFGT